MTGAGPLAARADRPVGAAAGPTLRWPVGWSEAARRAWLAERQARLLGLGAGVPVFTDAAGGLSLALTDAPTGSSPDLPGLLDAAAGAAWEESWRTIGGGARDAVQGLFDTGLWAAEGALAPLAAALGDAEGLAEAAADLRSAARLPEIAAPDGPVAAVTREAVRLAAGMGLVAPATAAVGLAPAGRAGVTGALADFATASPDAPRLSDLVEAVAPNPVTAALAARPGETGLLARLRSAAEGALLGTLAETIARAVLGGIGRTALSGGGAPLRLDAAGSPGTPLTIDALLAPRLAPGPALDVEGRRLTAPVIVGHGGGEAEVGLNLATLEWLGGRMVDDFRYLDPALIPHGGGRFSAPRPPAPTAPIPRRGTAIHLSDGLDYLSRPAVLSHELGHAIDYYSGMGLSDILAADPDLLADAVAASRRIRPALWADPTRHGYLAAPRELLADAASYYMLTPARFREGFPELARLIRGVWNPGPRARRWLQFNSLGWPLLALPAAGLLADREEDTAPPPRSPVFRSPVFRSPAA